MILGILDRSKNIVVSWYAGTRIARVSPFATDNYFHFEVVEQYPEGYSFNESGSLEYDFSYKPNEPLAEDMTETKLLSILEYYKQESAIVAAVNSVRMTELGYDTAQKMVFVNRAVLEMKPIKDEIEMFSFYNIWTMFDNLTRCEIMTEERITAMKSGLYAKVFE